MTTTYKITGRGGDHTVLHIVHNGRDYIYTGKTAEAIIAAMDQHAVETEVKVELVGHGEGGSTGL